MRRIATSVPSKTGKTTRSLDPGGDYYSYKKTTRTLDPDGDYYSYGITNYSLENE